MGKLRRVPFRCRGCQHRFYVYIPRERDDIEDIVEDDAERPENENDIAKHAEP
jgi:hypothetical protein